MAESPLSVREMEIEDLPSVFALGERLFTAEEWPTLYRTWDEYEVATFFASDGDYCLVAERDETVVGFIMGTLVSKRGRPWSYGWILWLGVEPSLSRAGVGRKLLDRLTEIFIEDGARMLIADTDAENEAALSFFKRTGFGSPQGHVYLSKNLTQEPGYLRRRRHRSARRRPSGRPLDPTPRPKPRPKNAGRGHGSGRGSRD